MRILILSTSERTGGAAIAARRLMEALGRSGVDARMLVRDRQTDDPRVTGVRAGLWRKAWERLCILLCNRLSRRGLWKVSLANTGVDITRRPELREAGGGMMPARGGNKLPVFPFSRQLSSKFRLLTLLYVDIDENQRR